MPGAGDFQLEKIDLLEDPYCLRSHQRTVENSGAIEMLTDEVSEGCNSVLQNNLSLRGGSVFRSFELNLWAGPNRQSNP